MSSTNNPSNGLRDLIHRLAEGVNSAQASYEIWFTLVGKDKAFEEFSQDMNDHRYVDFFHATIAGHCKLMFVEIACLFEKDKRTSSFYNLKKSLDKENRKSLVDLIDQELEPHHELIKNVRAVRDKNAAHHDMNWTEERLYKAYGIVPNHVRTLLTVCNCMIETIYSELIYSGGSYPVARIGRFENATYALLNVIRNGRS